MPRDYSSWETVKNISIVDMLLDTKNPRMPDDLEITQSAVIAIMEKKYNVIDIARSIGIQGFIPRENIIITYENNKPVVLEGNRRITALKLIYDPSLASENREEYKQIREKFEDINIILYPAVLIAPSRRDADPLIIDKHTENTEIPWKPIVQSKLYKRKKEEYGPISNKELAFMLGTTEQKILEAFQRIVLYNEAIIVAKGTPFSKKVEDPEGFEITTLERIMNLKDVQSRLHFTISETEVVTKDLAKFRAVLKLIVMWMFEAPGEKDYQRITSRSANRRAQIMRYIELAIEKSKRNENKGNVTENKIEDTMHHDDVTNNSDSMPNNNFVRNSASPNAKNRKPQSINDMPILFDRSFIGAANVSLYTEICTLKFNNYPNTIVVLIRVFLERVISRFLYQKKIKNIPSGSDKKKLEDAKLKDLLTYVVDNKERFGIDAELVRCINRFSNGKYDESASLSTLNNMIHYFGRAIGHDKAREIWTELSPIIEFFANNHKNDNDIM